VLFFHLREELASRRGSFGKFYSAKEAPKPLWDRNSYECGIISVKERFPIPFFTGLAGVAT
jgi:hypothetical protein